MGLISRVSSRTYRKMENNEQNSHRVGQPPPTLDSHDKSDDKFGSDKFSSDKFSTEMDQTGKSPYREQDIYLPLNNIATIMRKAVPSNGKVSRNKNMDLDSRI